MNHGLLLTVFRLVSNLASMQGKVGLGRFAKVRPVVSPKLCKES